MTKYLEQMTLIR